MFAEFNNLKDFLPTPGLDSDGAKGQLTAFKEKSEVVDEKDRSKSASSRNQNYLWL
jgi:hypothetical protein